jgi:hypothetical protein
VRYELTEGTPNQPGSTDNLAFQTGPAGLIVRSVHHDFTPTISRSDMSHGAPTKAMASLPAPSSDQSLRVTRPPIAGSEKLSLPVST